MDDAVAVRIMQSLQQFFEVETDLTVREVQILATIGFDIIEGLNKGDDTKA